MLELSGDEVLLLGLFGELVLLLLVETLLHDLVLDVQEEGATLDLFLLVGGHQLQVGVRVELALDLLLPGI